MVKDTDDRDAAIERFLRQGLSTREVTQEFLREFSYHVNPFDVSRIRRHLGLPRAKSGRKSSTDLDLLQKPRRPSPAGGARPVAPDPARPRPVGPSPARSNPVGPGPVGSDPTQALLAALLAGMRRLGLARVSMLADGSYVVGGNAAGDGRMPSASE